jgi:hypothetical protein
VRNGRDGLGGVGHFISSWVSFGYVGLIWIENRISKSYLLELFNTYRSFLFPAPGSRCSHSLFNFVSTEVNAILTRSRKNISTSDLYVRFLPDSSRLQDYTQKDVA